MWDEEVDLLVLGTGAGGLAAAARHAAERSVSGVPAPRNPADVALGRAEVSR